jgi:hypothetical protein
MKYVFLLPFTYFYATRLSKGALAFHMVFEWMAAALLVVVFGTGGTVASMGQAVLCYLAFISLYEIGYLVNDLFASRKEAGGRKRGPQGAGGGWVAAWMVARLMAFIFATALLGKLATPEWWSFFLALCVVFALHNGLTDREFKAATFLWLAWFRFMAPVMFVVQEDQRLGIGLAAAMTYASFRLLGYLDSKGLLTMPGRQRPGFRLFFFLMPLAGGLALWPYDGAQGFMVLTVYFALAAVLGTAFGAWRGSSQPKPQGDS